MFVGFGISALYLMPFETETLNFSAYFDPVSKVSILLPSLAASFSFHLQVINLTKIIKITETPITMYSFRYQ